MAAKKRTDYIEDEGMAYDDDYEPTIHDAITHSHVDPDDPEPDLPDLSISEEEERKLAETIAAATHERRMHNWERAMIMTQELAAKASKAMVTEFRLRLAQLAALITIAIILLVR